jgi:type IV secretory pathway VirB2 component (pilin)
MMRTLPGLLTRNLALVSLLWLVAVTPLAAQAMPWDTPLQTLLTALSGTTARLLGGLAILLAGGYTLAMGLERGGRMFISVLVGVSIMLAAPTLVAMFT